jgi:hemerythrin
LASPRITLDVPLMDDEHERLEILLDRASRTGDPDLPLLLVEVETETRAHFEREEDLMRYGSVPVLHCHLAQHKLFLSEFARGHEAVARGDMAQLRHFLCTALPQLLRDHVDTVDRVTASFLRSGDTPGKDLA